MKPLLFTLRMSVLALVYIGATIVDPAISLTVICIGIGLGVFVFPIAMKEESPWTE